MSKIDKKDIIKQFLINHFNCTDSIIESKISSNANILETEKGESIFFEGEKANFLYYIINGSIKLYRLNDEGKVANIKVVKKGEVFADIVLFDECKYPVNAVSVDQSTILCLNAKALKEIILSNRKLTESFIIMLTKRIKYLVNKIDMLELDNAENRLLSYLQELRNTRNGNEIILDLSKKEIAEIIGIRTETLSRLLKKMSNNGILKVRSKKITFLK
jgi:CRP/FNR family transcriptional regulator